METKISQNDKIELFSKRIEKRRELDKSYNDALLIVDMKTKVFEKNIRRNKSILSKFPVFNAIYESRMKNKIKKYRSVIFNKYVIPCYDLCIEHDKKSLHHGYGFQE